MQGLEKKGMQTVLVSKVRAKWQGAALPDDLLKRSTAGIAKGWLDCKLEAFQKLYDETYDDNEFHEPFGRICCVSYFLNSPWEQDKLVEDFCIALKRLIARDGMENVKAIDWRAVPILLPHLP
jgi:hypothetical protein